MGIHSGHRNRMFEKFNNYGFEVFAEHEKLEMILYFSVPRRDTNEIAHKLIEKYHTVANVMDAPKRELLTFDGITERTCQLFTIIKAGYKLYEKEKDVKKTCMTTVDEFDSFFQLYYIGETTERVAVVCLDSIGQVLKTTKLGKGNSNESFFNMQELFQFIMDSKANEIVIAHNHPGNNPFPSEEDIKTTEKIKAGVDALGIHLKDHFIVTESRCHSMLRDERTAYIFARKS